LVGSGKGVKDYRVTGLKVSEFQGFRVSGFQGFKSQLSTKFAEGFSPTGRCPKNRGVFSEFQGFRVRDYQGFIVPVP